MQRLGKGGDRRIQTAVNRAFEKIADRQLTTHLRTLDKRENQRDWPRRIPALDVNGRESVDLDCVLNLYL